MNPVSIHTPLRLPRTAPAEQIGRLLWAADADWISSSLRRAAVGTTPTLGECPHGVGQQPSAAQLSATVAAFDDRPHQLPGAGTDLPGWRSWV